MAEDKYLDKAGLAFYDAIQKGRLESVATLENQEKILSRLGVIEEKIEMSSDYESEYLKFAQRLEELI